MEKKKGIESWVTTLGNAPRHEVAGWRMKRIGRMSDKSIAEVDLDDSGWETANVAGNEGSLTPGETAAYRASIDVTEDQLKDKQTLLRIGRIDDRGIVYVNGNVIANTDDWSQVYTFDVASSLHAGKNVIAIAVKNTDGSGGLCQGVSFEPLVEQSLVNSTLEFADTSVGQSEKWWSAISTTPPGKSSR